MTEQELLDVAASIRAAATEAASAKVPLYVHDREQIMQSVAIGCLVEAAVSLMVDAGGPELKGARLIVDMVLARFAQHAGIK